eukprot:GHVU01101305.1.p1 GENE.GHVU01101305.1~~GHVU01101305.1.p1  ORF type:complete len:158 (-),score=1.72 GHVU01101305.1:40-513(-)
MLLVQYFSRHRHKISSSLSEGARVMETRSVLLSISVAGIRAFGFELTFTLPYFSTSTPQIASVLRGRLVELHQETGGCDTEEADSLEFFSSEPFMSAFRSSYGLRSRTERELAKGAMDAYSSDAKYVCRAPFALVELASKRIGIRLDEFCYFELRPQ